MGISRYLLYKEKPSTNDPEFFHIEDIKSRAKLFNWNISAHSHPRMYQLIYIYKGQVKASIDDNEYITSGSFIFAIPATVVHAFEFEQDTLGYVVTLNQSLLSEEQFSIASLGHDALLHTAHVIDLNNYQQDQKFIQQILDQLIAEYPNNYAGKQLFFKYLFFSLLIKLNHHLQQDNRTEFHYHYTKRYQQFCELIEKHYRSHYSCQFYADQLHTTTIGLNRACKTVAGKNAGDLIHDRIILEAQRMLIYSPATVSLIAYELGFTDPAYFSRFFKRRVGVAPSTFRDNRENH